MDDANEEFDSDRIRANGWRQGAACRAGAFFSATDRALTPADVGESDLLVAVSQDCDLVHHSLASEPWVEFVIARAARRDMNLWFGKNPRRLQVEITVDRSSLVHEIIAHERWFLPRALLCAASAAPSIILDQRSIGVLVDWLAKRYTRPAFPNAFNETNSSAHRMTRRKTDEPFGSTLSFEMLENIAIQNLQIENYTMNGRD